MNNGKTLFTMIVAFSVLIFVFNVDSVTQAVPGVLTHEDEYVQTEVQNSQIIMANTDEGSSVFVEKRGDSGYVRYQMTFYCDNRIIGGYSAGPAIDEYDGYSQNVSVEQFVEDVSTYDYIYFYSVDDAFYRNICRCICGCVENIQYGYI